VRCRARGGGIKTLAESSIAPDSIVKQPRRHTPSLSRRRCVRVLREARPLKGKRAQGVPGAGRTRRPRGLKRKMPTSQSGRAESHGTPCAMALRLTP
jgi:hypothetical protein